MKTKESRYQVRLTKVEKPLVIRLVHWGLAASVVAAVYFFEDGDDSHRYVGYLAVLFVGIRAFLGRVFKIASKKNNSREFLFKRMVHFLIWTEVVSLAFTGWLMGIDRFWGEPWLELTHEYLSQGLQTTVLIHLTGIFIDAYRFKRRTWLLMIKGRC